MANVTGVSSVAPALVAQPAKSKAPAPEEAKTGAGDESQAFSGELGAAMVVSIPAASALAGEAGKEAVQQTAVQQTVVQQTDVQKTAVQQTVEEPVEQPIGRGGDDKQASQSVSRGSITDMLQEMQTLKDESAASSKTAAAVAGLKPWHSDWVLGKDLPMETPDKPLIGEANPKLTPESLRGLVGEGGLKDLQKLQEMMQMHRGPVAGVDASATGQSLAADEDIRSQIQRLNGQLESAKGDPELKNLIQNGKTMTGLSGLEYLALKKGAEAGELTSRNGSTDSSLQLSGVSPQQGSESGRSAGGQMDQSFGESARHPLGSFGLVNGVKGNLEGKDGKLSFSDQLDQHQSTVGIGGVAANKLAEMSTKPRLVPQMDGQVTSGAMMQDRISRESLMNISSQIRTLGVAGQGGGEMRIRLKPDNLGELHVKVLTRGQEVALQIQASDGNAKKIIEESMSYLKETLSNQNMNLAKVDIAVSRGLDSAGSSLQDFANSLASHDRHDQAGREGRNPSSEGRSSGDEWNEGSGSNSKIRPSQMGAAGRSYLNGLSASGRLDVMA